jgi:hypothetical protein
MYHIRAIHSDGFMAEADMDYTELCGYLLTEQQMAVGDLSYKIEITFPE